MINMKCSLNLIILVVGILIVEVQSHGYMISPVNRASRWRLDPTNLNISHNENDNQYFCGGYKVQYDINNGSCGPCGDDWRDAVPRTNENGGTYGNGVVVATYLPESLIQADVILTINHLGYFTYQLCKLEDPDLPETEECFQNLPLADGSYSQNIDQTDVNVTSYLQLPENFTCDRCVLRWHWVVGDTWGTCENGTFAQGCGPQTIYRSCADIQISTLVQQ